MNSLARNKLIIGAAILLVAFNLVLMGIMGFRLLKSKEATRLNEPSPRKAQEFITRQLNLNPEQQEQFHRLRNQHLEEVHPIRSGIRETYRAMADELGSENPNPSVLDSLTRQIGKLHMLHQQQTINHFMKLREVCSPKQRVHLKKMLHRMIEPHQGMRQHRMERSQTNENRGKY